MASQINENEPNATTPTTGSIRTNFGYAKVEIVALQNSSDGKAARAGDLGGTVATTIVQQIQGRAIFAGLPNDGDVLTWNGALQRWEARAPETGPVTPPTQVPVITSANTATATVGTAFTYQITATNHPLTAYSASGFPTNGLTFTAASGVISGTPTTAGTVNTNITASNSVGASTPVALAITVSAVAPTGWQVTYAFPSPPTVFNMTTGRIPLTSMTGWLPAYAADMTDALYDATSQATLPVQLYATFAGQAEVQVDFDNWGGTAATNKITEWGFSSSDMSIYIIGNNATGNPIQLRLVKA